MAKKRFPIWLAVLLAIPGGIAAIVLGLFTYVNMTATPLHPDAQKVPSTAEGTPSAEWAGTVDQARQAARAAIVAQNLPSLSVAVGSNGHLVWAEGFGYADIDSHIVATPRTRFRVGDASKALTSAAVGRLLESHKIDLDSEIQTYVPDYPKKQWPVTVRELMAQTGGVSQDEGDEEPMDQTCERAADGLPRFAKYKLLFEPGTKYHPSSYGWILVSAAVETAANVSFQTFMHRELFQPLGMDSTRYDVWREPIPDRAAFYHPRFGGDPRYGPEAAREGDHSCFAGAGAFLSTPSDLVRFGMAFNGGTLLQPATVQLLQTEQHLSSGEGTGYGLGWKLETVPLAGTPARMAGHASKADFIGASTYLMTFPERALVVAAMTNTAFADMRAVALTLAETFAEKK
jgi:serine beta-lactamase-like protein LACTB